MLESLFKGTVTLLKNILLTLLTVTLLKKASTQVFSFEICEIFKNIYLEEHPRTAAFAG